MEKEFVPYELAVKLKELGFDDNCIAGYRDYNGIKLMTKVSNNTFTIIDNLGYGKYCHQNKHVIKAPLWQQALDFIREKYNLLAYPVKYIGYYYCIDEIKPKFAESIYLCNTATYDTHQEARLQCLTKLIEIVENETTKRL